MTTKAKNFREAYQVLQGHASTLREQTEPNIDDLLTIVKESVEAYKVCKERIDAVEKALQQTLTEVSTESEEQPSPSKRSSRKKESPIPSPKPSGSLDDLDDEIPF